MTLSPNPKTVVLIGAGGHARAVYGLLTACDYSVQGFYDNDYRADEYIAEAKALGILEEVNPQFNLILAVGDNALREKLFHKFSNQVLLQNIIHPSALLVDPVEVGSSNLIFHGVCINAFAKLGNNNLINTSAIIEHEVSIGSNNHISIGAILAGRVRIGNGCYIGAGAIIKDGVSITDNCTIGAGTVVLNNITESGTYVGIPAKKIK